MEATLQRRIRILLVGFMLGLIVSGATAFVLPPEVSLLAKWVGASPSAEGWLPRWIDQVRVGLSATDIKYPFLAYGTDWLAFAHLVIALIFVGPIRDPVRNVWVVQWAMIACILVVPLALLCGPVRGIPFGWTLIDCSFGVIGIVPLIVCLRDIRRLEAIRWSFGSKTTPTIGG
jgi:hypothetical protein